MKTPTRLLFGIRTSATVSLVVTANGTLPSQPPDLQISSAAGDLAIPCNGSTWTATLEPGEYAIRMPAPGDRWFEAPLTFTLSAPATIITAAEVSNDALTVCTAATGDARDPKNPWPPPLAGSVALAESTWLATTLSGWSASISVDRSAPEYTPPASATHVRPR